MGRPRLIRADALEEAAVANVAASYPVITLTT